MLDKQDVTVSVLKHACERKGYQFFERGDYNLNLIGIRSSDLEANSFNDLLCVAFRQKGHWVLFTFDCTTDPGVYWRKHPMNPLGTAVLVPGQYSGAYVLGMHKGRFKALTQSKALPVYRDADLDAEVDLSGTIDNGWHGINIHSRMEGLKSDDIGKWSAGCQVLKNYDEHMLLMQLCEIAQPNWGNRFTYTLLEEGDLW
ncbi:hypothetical protein [Neptuniibacter halophilus]|uniref:hypothetical protein n=1 Tax=Neptuniibacter halophilus TaxID=651666 RepID=UPI0025736A11|nr:hypothetical protein [Neptuniibacter halophilus]